MPLLVGRQPTCFSRSRSRRRTRLGHRPERRPATARGNASRQLLPRPGRGCLVAGGAAARQQVSNGRGRARPTPPAESSRPGRRMTGALIRRGKQAAQPGNVGARGGPGGGRRGPRHKKKGEASRRAARWSPAALASSSNASTRNAAETRISSRRRPNADRAQQAVAISHGDHPNSDSGTQEWQKGIQYAPRRWITATPRALAFSYRIATVAHGGVIRPTLEADAPASSDGNDMRCEFTRSTGLPESGSSYRPSIRARSTAYHGSVASVRDADLSAVARL